MIQQNYAQWDITVSQDSYIQQFVPLEQQRMVKQEQQASKIASHALLVYIVLNLVAFHMCVRRVTIV